ncbi:hypothetical protein ATE47_07870 [Chryseobacterium sp. IHB B 17019]|nr:hypothetical protein ATE47_07870 [Chryseobacterium sp. IHB B 17019]
MAAAAKPPQPKTKNELKQMLQSGLGGRIGGFGSLSHHGKSAFFLRCFLFKILYTQRIPLLWRRGENFKEIFDGVVL